MKKVILPELGEGINKAMVTYWHFKEGASIKEGEDLVEVATDKATFNMPAPASGTLTKILVQEGENVSVGSELAIIE